MINTGRRYVNEILLSEGEKYQNLHYHFEHKLTDIDVEKADLTFQCPGQKDLLKVHIIKYYVYLPVLIFRIISDLVVSLLYTHYSINHYK